jgi:hypothetical protein
LINRVATLFLFEDYGDENAHDIYGCSRIGKRTIDCCGSERADHQGAGFAQ